jgi:Flp pilus assembly secretin CpaC
VARDSQRTSDLNQITQQIATMQAKNGTSYTTMLNSGAANQLASPSLAGQSGSLGTNYFAGDVNYVVLGMDPQKF